MYHESVGQPAAAECRYRKADYVAEGRLGDDRPILVPMQRVKTDLESQWLILDASETRLWRLLDNPLTVTELQTRFVTEGCSPTNVVAMLNRLERGGVVTNVCTEPDPLVR